MNSSIFRDIATLVARVGLGIVFIAHGWQKLNTNGLDATKAGFEGMGVPLPMVSAYFATFVELVGGVALVVGIFTPIVGILLCSAHSCSCTTTWAYSSPKAATNWLSHWASAHFSSPRPARADSAWTACSAARPVS
jgi:uncharacterized membrane protein YphA (DoxX/SURF4 family)